MTEYIPKAVRFRAYISLINGDSCGIYLVDVLQKSRFQAAAHRFWIMSLEALITLITYAKQHALFLMTLNQK